MPEESVVFSPEIDERQLDKEVSGVDERLEESATDVPTSFSGEGVDDLRGDLEAATEDLTAQFDGQMDALSPAGAGGGSGGGGFGTGAAAGSAARGGGAAGLASKIPKPVAGVTAAAALPVALSGAVGVGMLSAMHGASASLQTSTSMLGQAWNNVWRPIGDRLDELFIRPVAKDILGATEEFSDFVGGSTGGGLREGWADRVRGVGALSGIAPGPIGDFMEGSFDLGADFIDPDENAFGNIADSITGAIPDSLPTPDWSWNPLDGMTRWSWSPLDGMDSWSWDPLNAIDSWSWNPLDSIATWSWNPLDEMSHWTWNPLHSMSAWVWSPLSGLVDGWSWDPLDGMADWVWNPLDDMASWSWNPSNYISGGDGGGWVGGVPDPGDIPDHIPTGAKGGRVGRTGLAKIHKDEFIGDRDRLVSELANAIGSSSGGGGGGSADMSNVERKLDRLNRNLKRLGNALDVTVQVGNEEIARATANGGQHHVADMDPSA